MDSGSQMSLKNGWALGRQSQARTLCVWKVTRKNVQSQEIVHSLIRTEGQMICKKGQFAIIHDMYMS